MHDIVCDCSRRFDRRYLKSTGISRLVNSRDHFWSERLKATPGRVRVLDVLKNSHTPLSARQIFQEVSETNLASIYRTLNILVKAGIVWKVYPRTRRWASFEIRPVSRKKNISNYGGIA